MRPQTQDDIIEELRLILIKEGDDTATLNEARVALSDWFLGVYPHLRERPQLRVIKGSKGAWDVMQYRTRYTADRVCAECARLVPVEVVVQDPRTIGYRCGAGHKWLAGKVTAVKGRRPVPVLAGRTGSPVADDDEDRPPWEPE